jgi:hypothetical protein
MAESTFLTLSIHLNPSIANFLLFKKYAHFFFIICKGSLFIHHWHRGDQIRATNTYIHLTRNCIRFWANQELYDRAKWEANGIKDNPFLQKSSIELIIIKIVNVGICGLLYFNLSDRWGYRDHPSYFFLVFLEATTYCGLTHWMHA